LRNLVAILLAHRHPIVAMRIGVTRGVLKPLMSLPIAPRAATRRLALNISALRDAWNGRLGRRVEPSKTEYPPNSTDIADERTLA
jgi:hypothetical protein